jgi:hypothetical protein
MKSHAIAQAVSRRIFTSMAPVPSEVMSRGICSGQSGTVAGFLFPLPILIPPAAPHLLIILTSTLCSLDAVSIVK